MEKCPTAKTSGKKTETIMKRIQKIISLSLAFMTVMVCFSSCKKENGLYTWYGKKINVDNVLDVTLDMGDGERNFTVSFETYRAIFLYYAGQVPNVTELDGEVRETTDDEKTDVAKKMSDEAVIGYYAALECAKDAGVDVDTILSKDYVDIYKNTYGEDGAKLYDEMLKKLGMTEEYFIFNCQKSELEKALKASVSSDIAEYTQRNYYHYKKILITYDIAEDGAREKALAEAQSIISALDSGEDFNTFVEKYASDLYESERYVDINGNIVGGKKLVGETLETVKMLTIGEHSGIIEEIESNKKGGFVILKKEGIDLSFLCGASEEATIMYSYQSAASNAEYTPHSLAFATLLDAYKQNLAVKPVDEKIYSRIAVDTLY